MTEELESRKPLASRHSTLVYPLQQKGSCPYPAVLDLGFTQSPLQSGPNGKARRLRNGTRETFVEQHFGQPRKLPIGMMVLDQLPCDYSAGRWRALWPR